MLPRNVLRATAALLVACVVALAALGPADAAVAAPRALAASGDAYGAGKDFTFHWGTDKLQGTYCAGTAFWVAPGDGGKPYITAKGKCYGKGPDNTVYPTWKTGSSISLVFSGKACRLSGDTAMSGDDSSGNHPSWRVKADGAVLAQPTDTCGSVDTVCAFVHRDRGFPFADSDYDDCQGFGLGGPPSPAAGGAGCEYMSISAALRQTTFQVGNFTYPAEQWYIRVSNPTSKPIQVGVVFYIRYPGYNTDTFSPNGSNEGTWYLVDVPPGGFTDLNTQKQDPGGAANGTYKIKSIEAEVSTVNGVQYQAPGEDTDNLIRNKPINGYTYGQHQGFLGINDPSHCRQLLGDKIIDLPNTDADEPAAPVDGPPPPATEPTDTSPGSDDQPADSSCAGFSLTDPSSWAGAGICVLVRLIGTVVGLLDRIVGAIGSLVGKIGDLLAALFIPKPSSWGVASVRDNLAARPPGSIVTGLGSGVTGVASTYSAPSSCGPIDFGSVAGTPIRAKCDGLRGNAAGMALYGLAAAGILIAAGIDVFRLLAGAVRT